MGSMSDVTKYFVKEFRHSWTVAGLVTLFILTLWTFQLALIIRFQTFWPRPPRIIKYDNNMVHQDSVNYGLSIQSRGVLSHNENLEANHFKVVCYYVASSSANVIDFMRETTGYCTHINAGFAIIDSNSTVVPQNPGDIEFFKDVVNLKILSPNLKVLLSVQDLNTGSFALVVSSAENRKRFASSALDFLAKYNFDGLDLDWEFPSWPYPNPEQRKNFTDLLLTIRTVTKAKNMTSLLTAAVAAPESLIIPCYDIPDMARFVDYVNVMSYDYHLFNSVTPVTGPNAPLYPRPEESTFLATLNTNYSASLWLFYGMPKEKLIIGVPTYGHSFTLLNENNNGWNAPAVGFGKLGQLGFISKSEACSLVSRYSATTVFDNFYKVPYAYDGREWISFETIESIILKAQFIKVNNFGGGMIFSLNSDDIVNSCGNGRFSLTKSFSVALLSNSSS